MTHYRVRRPRTVADWLIRIDHYAGPVLCILAMLMALAPLALR